VSRLLQTKIKEWRAKYNLSQEDLAARVNARRETINRLEKGQYNPSLKLAMDIAKELKTTVEEIFIFTD
jgi:DNA-binding XRE family transcriptional regulator